jgi:hypothetical protein
MQPAAVTTEHVLAYKTWLPRLHGHLLHHVGLIHNAGKARGGRRGC